MPVAVPFAGGGHLRAGQPGVHQHYLEGATATLSDIRAGDELYVWVYLDAQDPPRERGSRSSSPRSIRMSASSGRMPAPRA